MDQFGAARSSGECVLIANEIERSLGVGSIFADQEQVYVLYCEYARCKGFSVRRGEQRYVGRSDEIRWKEFICSWAGLPDCKSSIGRASCKKRVTRTDCKAKIRVSRLARGTWSVSIFEMNHNHEMLPIKEAYMLSSSRGLLYVKGFLLETLNSIGVGVSRKDAYNRVDCVKRASKLERGESNALLEYFINKSNAEPFFYWKAQFSDDVRIMSLFFRDSRCALDYEAFGDVLFVDTTQRTNQGDLICASFVGFNHHASNVMFGMAFMLDETTSSFQWLLEAFLESMDGKEPKVVFTNECHALMDAIASSFPNASHRLCQWHINRNAPSHFGSLYGNPEFKSLWDKCMNQVETEFEFEELWRHMMRGYSLFDNKWFAGMYELRHRWASVFTRGIFTAGLLATSVSEVTNRVLKDICRSINSLVEFVRAYEQIQLKWRAKESADDAFCLSLPDPVVAESPLLARAATLYTDTVFKSFESEAMKSSDVNISDTHSDLGNGNLEFKALPGSGEPRVRAIVFNKESHVASCSCRMWETEGIFCRHILRVYYMLHVSSIPKPCIVKRWTKRAKFDMDFGPSNTRFIKYVTMYVYDMVLAAKDSEEARELIIRRLNELVQDLTAMKDASTMHGQKGTRKNASGIQFRDPNPTREGGFRGEHRWDSEKRKGKKRASSPSFATLEYESNSSTSKLDPHFGIGKEEPSSP